VSLEASVLQVSLPRKGSSKMGFDLCAFLNRCAFEDKLETLPCHRLVWTWAKTLRLDNPTGYPTQAPDNEYLPEALRLAAWLVAGEAASTDWQNAVAKLEASSWPPQKLPPEAGFLEKTRLLVSGCPTRTARRLWLQLAEIHMPAPDEAALFCENDADEQPGLSVSSIEEPCRWDNDLLVSAASASRPSSLAK